MQNLLKQLNINSLSFYAKSLDYRVEVAVDDIPTCSLLHLLQYGTRKINDQFNSGKDTNGASPEYFDYLIQNMKDGKIGERRANGLTKEDKAIRELILNHLLTKGYANDIVDECKSLSPVQIVDKIWEDKDEQTRDDILGRFITKYEQIKAIRESEMDI